MAEKISRIFSDGDRSPRGEDKKGGKKDSPDGKRGLGRLKIAKKAYVFEVRRKYPATWRFKIAKAAETPAEEFKDNVLSFFSKEKKHKEEFPLTSEEARIRDEGKNAAPPGPVSPDALKAAFIVAAIFILSIVALFVVVSSTGGYVEEPLPASSIFSGDYSFNLRQTEVVSYLENDKVRRVANFLAEYSTENISEMNFNLRLYAIKPTTQVFLLDYPREGSDSYPVFRKSLMESLRAYGIPVDEIGMDYLPFVPGSATVVVPTGYFPKELLGIDSEYDYKDLLSRGVNIVYIGLEFDRALARERYTIPVSQSDLTFSRGRIESTNGFSLFDPKYSVSSKGGPSGLMSEGMIYGSVSIVRKGNGYLIFLPQNLDGGWRGNGDTAAFDVSRLIREQVWLSPIATLDRTVMIESEEGGSGRISMFSSPFDSDHAFVEMTATATDLGNVSKRETKVFRIEKEAAGELTTFEKVTIPYQLSGQKARLNILLQEPDNSPVKLFVRAYKDSVMFLEDELELGLTDPTTEKSIDLQIDAEPGTYVIRVEDSGGKPYAVGKMDVVDVSVDFASVGWAQGVFSFILSANGQRVSPRSVSVSLDGKGEKLFSPSSITYSGPNAIIEYTFPGKVEIGEHYFTITSGSWNRQVSAEYIAAKNFWDNPLVIVLGLLSVLIFGAGMVLRRPAALRYGLDVPDFPPLSKIKIPVKRETVLEIFENVNAGFSWQWMPLKIDEVKKGFRRLTYKGKPISIGDFNLERILTKLRDKGFVEEKLDYWGMKRWEEESKHSLYYLVIYRIMRNIFVNNAVRFSKLDAMKDCDLKAIAGKEALYFHIMEGSGEAVVHRALATARKGTTIIVFEGDDERDNFLSKLNSASRLAVALKMEINNGKILLLPVKKAISAFLKGMSE